MTSRNEIESIKKAVKVYCSEVKYPSFKTMSEKLHNYSNDIKFSIDLWDNYDREVHTNTKQLYNSLCVYGEFPIDLCQVIGQILHNKAGMKSMHSCYYAICKHFSLINTNDNLRKKYIDMYSLKMVNEILYYGMDLSNKWDGIGNWGSVSSVPETDRYDIVLKNTLDNFLKTGELNLSYPEPKELHNIHICTTNDPELQKQDISLCVGLRLICSKNHKVKHNNRNINMYNSQFFTVTDYNSNTFTIQQLNNKMKICNQRKITENITDLHKYFDLGYCNSVYCYQSTDIYEPYTIHNAFHMTKRELYTALSRSAHSSLIHISGQTCKKYHENNFKVNNTREPVLITPKPGERFFNFDETQDWDWSCNYD